MGEVNCVCGGDNAVLALNMKLGPRVVDTGGVGGANRAWLLCWIGGLTGDSGAGLDCGTELGYFCTSVEAGEWLRGSA